MIYIIPTLIPLPPIGDNDTCPTCCATLISRPGQELPNECPICGQKIKTEDLQE